MTCTAQILKRHVNDCFEIVANKWLKWLKKGKTVKFKNWTGKIKLLFMTYADFETFLIPGNKENQNPDEFYKNKHQCVLMISLANLLSHIS